jgi:ATP-dependent RNA helicase DeaD
LKTFNDLGIKQEFIEALNEMKITTPTDIQVKSIPFLLENGTDFIGKAQTGTGKTAAFGLPLLHRVDPEVNKVQALILTPTRELCQQIAKHLFKYTKFSNKVFVEAVYGGEKIEKQTRALLRPTHIIVATPGRLIELVGMKAIDLSDVEVLVLDEADEMLSMGFKDELDQIIKSTNESRNTWLFSATFPEALQGIVDRYMSKDTFRVEVDKQALINTNIEHQFVTYHPAYKLETLIQFLHVQGGDKGIVFCRTKSDTQSLADQLKRKDFAVEAIHGDLQQREREKSMRIFKNSKTQLLITTDVSARGIDVQDIAFVVHYDLPEMLENYTHRSGRTARAGKKGVSISFIQPTEIKRIRQLEKSLRIKFTRIQEK